MKKSLSSAQILSDNLKKYLKRAGIVVASAALGTATFITISSDKATVYSDSRMVSIAEVQTSAVEESAIEYDRIEYVDLQNDIEEAERLAQVERSDKQLAQTASADTNIVSMSAVTETTEEPATQAATTEKATTEKATTEAPTTEATTVALTTEATTEPVVGDGNDDTIEVEVDGVESGTYLGSYVTTAYCGCSKCCGKSDGITASGTVATEGRTVAAPSSLAFGTEIIINGHTYVVEDRGGSINGNRIDIYFDSHQEALNYGRKTVDVYVK